MAAEIRDCVNHVRRSTESYQKTLFKMRRNNKESIFLLLINIIKEYYNAVFSIDNDNSNEKEMGMTQKTLSLILCISLEKLPLKLNIVNHKQNNGHVAYYPRGALKFF